MPLQSKELMVGVFGYAPGYPQTEWIGDNPLISGAGSTLAITRFTFDGNRRPHDNGTTTNRFRCRDESQNDDDHRPPRAAAPRSAIGVGTRRALTLVTAVPL